MLRQIFSNGKSDKIYIKNKHDHSHTLKILSTSTTCKNSFNLLLKYLTEKDSYRDEGIWFQILLALYLTVFAVICRNRIQMQIFSLSRII